MQEHLEAGRGALRDRDDRLKAELRRAGNEGALDGQFEAGLFGCRRRDGKAGTPTTSGRARRDADSATMLSRCGAPSSETCF